MTLLEMRGAASPRPVSGLLLRAEVGGGVAAAILVRADLTAALRSRAPALVGDRIRLRVSFPRLLAPLDLDAEVTGARAAGAPGERAEWQLALVPGPAAARVSALVASAGAPPVRSTCRVLLVEASAMLVDVFRARLRHHLGAHADAVEVDVAADPAAAWAALQAQADAGRRYDLVVIDDAPDVPGTQIARLRQSPALATTPVVAVSVGGDTARAAAFAAGADLFLDKPLVLAELWTTIDLLLRKGVAMTPKRILIMDDSALFLELTRDALVQAGYDVATAHDLGELERSPDKIDLVLMDVQMPEAFGDDLGMVLRHVRGLQAQIFLLSSLDPDDLGRRVAEAGLDGFISKHVGIDGVVARVDEITGGAAAGAQVAP